MSAALERGDRVLREYQELLERGTPDDIITDEVLRGAAIRWDILRRRALYPVVEPTQAALWANAERLRKLSVSMTETDTSGVAYSAINSPKQLSP
jgi:hypothetical protein